MPVLFAQHVMPTPSLLSCNQPPYIRSGRLANGGARFLDVGYRILEMHPGPKPRQATYVGKVVPGLKREYHVFGRVMPGSTKEEPAAN